MNLTFIKAANLCRTRREDRRSQLGEGTNREDRDCDRLQQSMMGKKKPAEAELLVPALRFRPSELLLKA